MALLSGIGLEFHSTFTLFGPGVTVTILTAISAPFEFLIERLDYNKGLILGKRILRLFDTDPKNSNFFDLQTKEPEGETDPVKSLLQKRTTKTFKLTVIGPYSFPIG